MNKEFYYLFTSSISESKYKDFRGRVHNTAFNNNYVFNLLAGKEFIIGQKDAGKQKSFDVNIKTTWAGGKRRTPFTTVFVDDEYEQDFDYNKTFRIKMDDYFRTDLRCGFKINVKNVTQEWAIEITNLFNTQNIFDEDFNSQNR